MEKMLLEENPKNLNVSHTSKTKRKMPKIMKKLARSPTETHHKWTHHKKAPPQKGMHGKMVFPKTVKYAKAMKTKAPKKASPMKPKTMKAKKSITKSKKFTV